MNSEKIYDVVKETLKPLITVNTPVHADTINDAIGKAIVAALKEYEKQTK